jgi:putative molybdopterin biosynthesis protein
MTFAHAFGVAAKRNREETCVKQEQFLNVLDRDEAERRFRAVLDLRPLGAEEIALSSALSRVLACDVVAPVDVPSFDRSNVDGFAVRAEDTFGASEDRPCTLHGTGETLPPGVSPRLPVGAGEATTIATGAMLPRGANAVVMVEHTDHEGSAITVRRPMTPGANISFAGTDIGRGETVLRRGDLLTSRETGVLAAIGVARVSVVRRPKVAILSTGNELIAPGQAMQPGRVYDSNATILADAVRELGCEAIPIGIVPDDREHLRKFVKQALAYDVVLLSGGTSKGEGDLCYRVVAELEPPAIVVHGVALKPGKPLCLAATRLGERIVPVVILPGFPTSAIFTFHEFVAPVLRLLAGRSLDASTVTSARLPMRVNSERGRTEYLLVGLIEADDGLAAYPMGKGSGSVTTFSRADGFVAIPRQQEYVEADTLVEVHLLGHGLKPADLVVIGSHCVGLDFLLGQMQSRGFKSKFLAVGSTGGLEAVRRGECDLAGIHLLDPKTNVYNQPFLSTEMELLPGYRRIQGLVFRPDDARFAYRALADVLAAALADADCRLVNRNRGSGTRILIDRLLDGAQPAGYSTEVRSHNAVVAAVAQRRADWGVAIETVANDIGVGFLSIQEENYDFVVPKNRRDRPAVRAFRELLREDEIRTSLRQMGFILE